MSRNVRVAGSLHEEGENVASQRFALFTACSTAFLIITTVHVATGALILGTSFLLTQRAFGSVARETEWQ